MARPRCCAALTVGYVMRPCMRPATVTLLSHALAVPLAMPFCAEHATHPEHGGRYQAQTSST